MGMPGSGYLPHEIKERFGYIDRLFDAPHGHPYHDGLRKGHTDDTEFTMLIIDMILEDGEVTPNEMAKRMLFGARVFNAAFLFGYLKG
jgi:ADP-ribosylglycohydrolase